MPSVTTKFRHVLCPVDFSEYSRTALRYAAALARRDDGRLTVLFVNDPLLGTAAAAAAYDVKALEAKTDAELRRFVARAIGEPRPPSAMVTAFGQAAHEIQQTAKRLEADVVVLGSRGLTGPGKFLFGSTTERVLRTTIVPVLVVAKQKRRSLARWGRDLNSWPGKRIIVPIDLQDYSIADVRVAMDTARAFGATPLALYVMPPVQFPPWLRLNSRKYDRDRIVSARTELEKLAKSTNSDCECRVVVGDPAAEIATVAAERRAGLIVLTLKRAAAAFGPRQGAITYRLISTEAAPVLALPQKPRRS